jgi:hypothetical protein
MENDESRHLFVCLCVRHEHSWIAAKAAAMEGWARCPGRFSSPIVPYAPPCVSLGLKKPGDFTVFEGHGYPLVKVMPSPMYTQPFTTETPLATILSQLQLLTPEVHLMVLPMPCQT